jgi:hypothetical protein
VSHRLPTSPLQPVLCDPLQGCNPVMNSGYSIHDEYQPTPYRPLSPSDVDLDLAIARSLQGIWSVLPLDLQELFVCVLLEPVLCAHVHIIFCSALSFVPVLDEPSDAKPNYSSAMLNNAEG